MGLKSGDSATVSTPASLMASSSFFSALTAGVLPQAARAAIMPSASSTHRTFFIFFIIVSLSIRQF